MAKVSINVHDPETIVASAETANGTGWLHLQFGTTSVEMFTIFMPFERAKRLANAINAAEAMADIHDGAFDSKVELDKPVQSYADEHRLRQHEVL